VDVEFTKILSKLLLLLWTDILEILATENDNPSLRNKQGQFILLFIAKLAQLQALDFSSDARGQSRDHYIGIIILKTWGLGVSRILFVLV
jgi:hypothetical protein